MSQERAMELFRHLDGDKSDLELITLYYDLDTLAKNEIEWTVEKYGEEIFREFPPGTSIDAVNVGDLTYSARNGKIFGACEFNVVLSLDREELAPKPDETESLVIDVPGTCTVLFDGSEHPQIEELQADWPSLLDKYEW
jgi:hypothetical protein